MGWSRAGVVHDVVECTAEGLNGWSDCMFDIHSVVIVQ